MTPNFGHPPREIPLKLLALALAIVVWLRVTSEEKLPLEISVPLELQNLPDALTFLEEVPSSVRVRLRAPRAIIDRISPGDVEAKKDISDAQIGSTTIQLSASDVRVPFGAEVVSVAPLRMTIEQKVRKKVPLIPDVRGKAPEGYELRGVSVTPKEVEVEGPEGAVQVAIEATTEVLLLTGHTTPFTERVKVDPKSASLHLTDPRPAVVEIIIEEKTAEKTIDGVKVECRGPDGISSDPPEITVVLTGPASALASVGEGALTATAVLDVPEESKGPWVVTPSVVLSPQLQSRVAVKEVRPQQVQVRRSGEGQPPHPTGRPGRK